MWMGLIQILTISAGFGSTPLRLVKIMIKRYGVMSSKIYHVLVR